MWRFQLKQENKMLQNNYERELSIIKERLLFVDYDDKTITLDNIVKSIPIQGVEIIELLKNKPVDLIKEYVELNHELANELLKTRNKYLKLIKVAKKFDKEMDKYIRLCNAEKDIGAFGNDANTKTYFIGRIYNYNDKEIEPWIDVGVRDWMKEPYANFNKEYQDLIQRFLKGRKELLDRIKAIEKLIKTDEG
ncbi:hypothetical protein [Virgibacillus kimchii]